MSSKDDEDEQADNQSVGASDEVIQEHETMMMNVVPTVSMDDCGCYSIIFSKYSW